MKGAQRRCLVAALACLSLAQAGCSMMRSAGAATGESVNSGFRRLGNALLNSRRDTIAGVQTPAERIAHIRSLGEAAGGASASDQEKSAAELAQLFPGEPDPVIRREIVRAAGLHDSPSAMALLIRAIDDGDGDVRVAACEAWGRHPGPEAVQALGRLVGGDTDMDVRIAAARALERNTGPAAVQALALALEDPNPALQHCAVRSLAQVSGKDYGSDVNAWREYCKGGEPQVKRDWFVTRWLWPWQ